MQCKLHFSNLIPFFFFFSLQGYSAYGDLKIVAYGVGTVSRIFDDDTANAATLTGTAIVDLQPGQMVSDSLLFYVA